MEKRRRKIYIFRSPLARSRYFVINHAYSVCNLPFLPSPLQKGLKMTESQLPAAAAAQKFGTLIPNRIFGELARRWWSGFFFLAIFSNCIMSFPYIFNLDAARWIFPFRVPWQCSSSRFSWRNKVINYPSRRLLPEMLFLDRLLFLLCKLKNSICVIFACVWLAFLLVPRPPRVNCVEYSQLTVTSSRRKSS